MSILTMHHGLMAGAGKKAPPVDPHIILLWDGVSSYGPQPTSGVTPTIHYDANGPLDVIGTGWSGTPYVNAVEMGGYAPNVSALARGSGYGLHWTQNDFLSKIDPTTTGVTIEGWVRRKTSGGDGNPCFGFFSTNNSYELCPGVRYGNIASWYNGTRKGTAYTDAGNVWHHVALTNAANKFYMFVDGSVVNNTQSGTIANIDIFTICSGYLGDYRGDFDVAQVAVWDMAKYTAAFTPPTRPYILGT